MTGRLPDHPRIGVIGLGRFGSAHVGALSRVGCPPVAVADPDEQARTRITATLASVAVYADAAQLLDRSDLDGVTIATPSATHVDLAIEAVGRGLVTLVEKPVATGADELARLLAADGAELVVPGHVLRFDPAHEAVRDLVTFGRLGTIRMISAQRDRDRGHLALFDDPDPIFLTQIHDLDLALWIDGSTPEMISSLAPPVAGRRPAVFTRARSRRGTTWSLRASYLLETGAPPCDRLEIFGDLGVARLSVDASGARLTLEDRVEALVGSWAPVEAPGLDGEMQAFVAAGRHGRGLAEITVAEAAQVIEMAVAARTSTRHEGAPTSVDQTPPAERHRSGPTAKAAALIPREQWQDLSGTYLYTGAQAPALVSVGMAIRAAFDIQSAGPAGRVRLAAVELGAQEAVARWAGCSSSDVAFVGDASTAWNMVAGGLSWEAGDNVVINDLEHPSVVFPFMRLSGSGLECRVVGHSDGWVIDPEDVAAEIDEGTRAVVISHVSYVNGARNDVAAIARVADRAGVPLFVDWSHSLGVLPVDSDLCAIGISASYKWALGPYGVGVIIWNQPRLPDFRPGAVGWRSTPDFFHHDRFERFHLGEHADRFRLGAASYSGIAGLSAGLGRLNDLGVTRVADHTAQLGTAAYTALLERGFDVISPSAAERRGGSVALRHDRAMPLADLLARDGIQVWAGDGRLRASFHVMNGMDDVTTLVDGLVRARAEVL